MKYYLVPADRYDQPSKPQHERPNIEHMFPRRLQSKAKLISIQLHSIAVGQGDNGTILLDDTALEGSNYIDLIRYLLYKTKLPERWVAIKEYLKNKNFPSSLIPNSDNIEMKTHKSFIWL